MSTGAGLAKKLAAIADRSFAYIAIALVPIYFFVAYLNRELGLEKLEKAFLGSSLLILVVSAIAHSAGLARSRDNLERITSEIGLLRGEVSALAEADEVKVFFREGRNEVYTETLSAIRTARHRVWVTYLRNEGPLPGAPAAQHFQACRDWARGSNDDGSTRSFRRIIIRGDSADLRDFCEQELKFIAELAANGEEPNYAVKVLTDHIHLAKAFNVGIFDDTVIFTHRQENEAIGICMRSKRLAESVTRLYFERLWNSSDARKISADALS
ncbi:hypothetical protein [Actinoplanes siamensis]|uniref:Uncharacterized protein n=1 Tax=Actinoplanes siamensis TaxID=1223317 RepID=A0A919TNP0_9ACTN|nr:hypothetical protein [Actinoplanes siamensis]GIF08932.1 hypothetical protein Asi03nite_64700 [Actinoplanes siamensis]